MNLSFERVFKDEHSKIKTVYEIIKISGERMFKDNGLSHWKNPYPIESIQRDCFEKEVFLIKDTTEDVYIHTFQLGFEKFLNNNDAEKELHTATINKFATVPEVTGKGIGKKSIDYIEDYCREKGVSLIKLDVYEKSEHAISFYKKRGFEVTGSKPTRNFKVYLMEKKV